MKKYKYKSEKYQIAYNNQISIKNILNSMYGAMGSNYFRLYQPECADAITYFARKSILYAREYFEKLGYIVNYIDTDSIFLLLQDKDPEEVKKELPKFIISLKENVVKKYCTNIDDSFYMFDLEFEKLLTHVYFSNTKKRYYGIQDTGEKYIRGLNIIRKDTPLFLKKELDVLSEKVVRGELTLNYLNNLKNKVESADYIDVGIIKSYTKKLRSYVKTMPQHVKAANFANKVFNTSITYIDNPYMFYITAKEYPENTEICLLPENFNILKSNDVFEIDYNTFFDKQVITPLEEFKYIDEIKDLVFEYKSQNKEFYASYFKRINKIKEKLSIGKELGKGEMIIYEENKKNILLYNE